MKRLIALTMLLGAGFANATPIEPSLFATTGFVESNASTYTLNGNQAPVESLFLHNYWIDATVQSLTFDILFFWDRDLRNEATNILAFRLFSNGFWQNQWTAYSPNDLWRMEEPAFGDILASVSIDLSPYQNSFVAMGWSFIASAPELSSAQISNIDLETVSVSEPSLLALIFLAGLGIVVARRYWRFGNRASA